ncbi:MAG: cobalt transporter CbiM [Desulfobacterales bacterium]|nr:cobalt transporter CbiM [Desulfobacterales bacterium]MCP4160593.1 cobalt transporter CbiM [Deltaproteobacteria bacterium]
MHLSEGVLTGPVLVAAIAATAVGTAVGLRKLKNEDIPKASLLSASFFVATFIHLPIGVGSVHLVLNGIIGLMLGWTAFPVILVALLLQGVMFQFGGITILGVNTIIMAVPSVICFYLFKNYIRNNGNTFLIASFSCGFLAVLLSGLLSAAALYISGEEFLDAAYMLIIANIPVMIGDGIITTLSLSFLRKVQPEILS